MAEDLDSHAPDAVHDAFLSYNSRDFGSVQSIAHRLADEGASFFFDRWSAVAGRDSQQTLERALGRSRSCVVFWGPSGAGPWQSIEVRAALSRWVDEPDFPVIPVLLPGSPPPEQAPDWPRFLSLPTRIDLRGEGRHDAGIAELCAAMKGEPPGRPPGPPPWLRAIEIDGLVTPTGIAHDGSSLYVADHNRGALLRIENGVVTATHRGLARPHHVAAMAGRIVVCDTYNDRLVCLSESFDELWSCERIGGRPLVRPHGVFWESDSNLLVANTDRNSVHRLFVDRRAGKVVERRSARTQPALNQPCGVTARPDAVLVADTFSHNIRVLTFALQGATSFGSFGYGDGYLAYPVAVACWHDWVVVSDEYNQRLQLWRLTSYGGAWSAICLSSDVCGEWLGSPFGVVFTPYDGKLWVSDRKRGLLLCIDFPAMTTHFSADKG